MSGQLPSGERDMTDVLAFDLEFCRQRSQERHLTDGDLAALCGIPVADWGRRLTPHTLSAAALFALARALDTSPESLLDSGLARPLSRPAAGAAEPATVLHAALLETGPLHPDDAASALQWPARQLQRAAQDLAARLEQQAGPHRLVHTDTTLHLAPQPGLLTPEQEQNLHEGGHTAASLSPGEAAALTHLLHTAARGLVPAVPAGQIPRLAARGLLAPDDGRQPAPHPDVLFALGLAARPLPATGSVADAEALVPAATGTPPPGKGAWR
ncbi:hypothetical protein ACO0M4_28750 [Streptomyces sp. RGM 3693]|uniref:hypothetical protein n=1 Tax=Streptomyces sp. RGM 3693 TaxID=3413284 RepID=UPI003D2A4F66